MPKVEIDYSNTIIYKITCKNKDITDVYVGHTTNFVQRKYAHKQSCINMKSPNHKCKLYDAIRANGGWENWQMEIINFFNCADHYAARIKEQEYFTELKATLNSIEPLPKPKDLIIPELVSCEKKSDKFICECCDYNTSRKSSIDKHYLSAKHINKTKLITTEQKSYKCKNCIKSYKVRNSLWYHEKNCKTEKPTESIMQHLDNTSISGMVVELLRQNQILQKQILELCKFTEKEN